MPLSIKTGAVKVKDSEGDYVDIDLTLSDGYAPLESPAFTGTPTAPTPGVSDDSTKVATTAFVQDVVDSLDAGDIAYSSSATYNNGTAGKELQNLNGAINSNEHAIGVVVDGDTASPSGVSAGAYVYVKNNTHGLSDGMYITKTAFPTSGGTANSSVFEAASYGAMNSATSNKVGVPNTTYINSDSYSVSRRFGRIAVAVGSNIKPTQNITGTTAFITGLDPAYAVTYFPMISTDGTSVARAYINTTGEIHIFWSTMTTGKEYYFNASYITQF